MAEIYDTKRLFFYGLKLSLGPDFNALDENGQPKFLDFSNLDWRAFSAELIQAMDMQLPKSMRVYLGNDAMHLGDIGASQKNPEQARLGERVESVLEQIRSKDCWGGVLNLANHREALHPVAFPIEKSPPAIQLVFAVKCTSLQLLDYESDLMTPFGALVELGLPDGQGRKDRAIQRSTMSDAVHEVICKYLELPYMKTCAPFLIRSHPLQ